MTDAIVIVLTLAIAALVLWLPVWVVNRWATWRVVRPTADDLFWLDDCLQTHTYVQPHMRKGRPVHGYYRRLKR